MEDRKRLYRSRKDRMIAGVAGGLGDYFETDPMIFRALFVLLAVGHGAGLLIYLFMAIVVPAEPGPDGASSPSGLHDIGAGVERTAHEAAEHIRRSRGSRRSGELLGALLVLVGALLLLDRIFPQTWLRWDIAWPGLLIVFGAYLMFRRREP